MSTTIRRKGLTACKNTTDIVKTTPMNVIIQNVYRSNKGINLIEWINFVSLREF